MRGLARAERPSARRPGAATDIASGSPAHSPTAARSAALSRSLLIDLQRLAGNAAVATLTGPGVQRDDAESKGGAPPQSAGAIDVVFVIQRPNDQYTKDMNDYVQSTLKGDVFVPVANLQEMCAQATRLTSGGKRLRKIRVASHGQTVT